MFHRVNVLLRGLAVLASPAEDVPIGRGDFIRCKLACDGSEDREGCAVRVRMGGNVILYTGSGSTQLFQPSPFYFFFAKAFAAKVPTPKKKGNRDIYIYIPLNPLKMTT
jgi:hypothetical protein